MNYSYTVTELCRIFGGSAQNIFSDTRFQNFAIDSRKVQWGDLFICLTGERTDGHLYIQDAIKRGASCIVASRHKIKPGLLTSTTPIILVADPNRAFRDLARDYRHRLSPRARVIGITGSNGKTSTKEITAGLCRFLDNRTHATSGNFNNFVGVPLTILDAKLDEQWWVIEMGTNHFGEIETLAKVVHPHCGIITNIGESHLEFLESTEGVAHEKSGIFQGMESDSIVVVPSSLKHLRIVKQAAAQHGIRLVTYGFTHWEVARADYMAELLYFSPAVSRFRFMDATFETRIGNPLFLENLLGALTLLRLQNVDMELLRKATQTLSVEVQGRMQFREMNGYLLVNDTYNANPTSFKSVLASLRKAYPKRRLLVVAGPMAELGEESLQLHQQLGAEMHQQGVAHLFALGEDLANAYVQGWKSRSQDSPTVLHTEDLQELIAEFQKIQRHDDIVLVKGSRSAHMERVVEALAP